MPFIDQIITEWKNNLSEAVQVTSFDEILTLYSVQNVDLIPDNMGKMNPKHIRNDSKAFSFKSVFTWQIFAGSEGWKKNLIETLASQSSFTPQQWHSTVQSWNDATIEIPQPTEYQFKLNNQCDGKHYTETHEVGPRRTNRSNFRTNKISFLAFRYDRHLSTDTTLVWSLMPSRGREEHTESSFSKG